MFLVLISFILFSTNTIGEAGTFIKSMFGLNKLPFISDSIYVDAYTTSLGFDSIFYLNLSVHPSYVDVPSMTVSVSTCQYSSYEWSRSGSPVSTRLYSLTEGRWIPSHAIPTDVVGDFVYVDSLQTIHGCDSVWKLHLSILPEYLPTVFP